MNASLPPALQARLALVRALCFDLDGTLLDTIPDLAAAANAMLTDLGTAPPSGGGGHVCGKGGRPADRTHAGGGRGARCHRHAGLRRGARALPRQLSPGQWPGARLYPGVLEGLQKLQAQGLPMAVVTNKPFAYIEPLLVQFGLAPFFAFSIGGDSLPVRKPDPGQLLEACRRLTLTPADVLMVGDSLNDTQAARAAGMPVVILPYGYNEGRPLDSVDADAVIQTIDQLADWLALPGDRT